MSGVSCNKEITKEKKCKEESKVQANAGRIKD